jgi:hypothetical protein
LQCLLKMEQGLEVFSKVKDKRQIQVLQIRMHNALEDYFNFQGKIPLLWNFILFNFFFQVEFGKHNYDKLNSETSENNEKLFLLEDSYHDSVDRITDFLKNQMDFSLVRQQAMQKVQREELEEEYNAKKSLNDSPGSSKQMKQKAVNFKLENIVH